MDVQTIDKYLTINELAALKTPVLSKIKIGETVYYLKDADLRQIVAGFTKDIVTGTVANELTDGGTGFAQAGTIKSYVDNLVSAGLVIIALKEGETLPTASKDTTGKMYLVPENGVVDGTYVEYITVIGGTEEAPTYAWEQIGTTETDLGGYLKDTATVAGVAFGNDQAISADELKTALELKALAYKDSATGTVEAQTISGVKATGDVSGTATIETTDATVTSTGSYTPAGSVTGEAIKGGSIAVTVKDEDAASEAALSYSAYTPAGSVAIAKDNENGVEISGTVSKPDITVDDSATDTFVKSLKAGTTDAATFTEGTFTPAEIQEGFYTAGTAYSVTDGGVAYDTAEGKAETKSSFNTDAVKAHIAAGEEITGEVDAETLVIESAATSEAVTKVADLVYTAQVLSGALPTVDTSKFSGGSKAADTFAAEKLPVVDGTAAAVTAVTAQLAAAPTFTGDKFSASFSGTEVAEMKVTKAEYLKQTINTATFTPEAATLGFSGTSATVSVSGTYAKVNETATVSAKDVELAVGDIAVATKTVTVS